jgi:hypothetical protein
MIACLTAGAGFLLAAPAASPLPTPTLPASTLGEPAGLAAEPLRYGRDIRPILSDRCFLCHGPDAATRHADLRLDVREEATATRKGVTAIVPGRPEQSELWRRITSHDANDMMPPPDSNKRTLSESERALVRRWIEEGAVYEPHWAFIPPERPAPPAVTNEAWVRSPIDRFTLAAMERANATPSPEADRETLARRLFLDLTGLPPTPEEIDAFVGDTRPDAYERLVDRLLTEEPYRTRYAERMTAPWLDAARYADTCGIHMDAGRSIWLWRDWVIDAYRTNMPFDRFVVEQVSGDLLPNASDSQRVASGFNRNHVTTDEGGAIAEEYLVEYAVDRVSTTGSVFLGLTLGCARCHDHKYDPISQQEFFQLYAYFNSIEEPGLYSQEPDPTRAFEPFLAVPSIEQRDRLSAIGERLGAAKAAASTVSPEEERERERFLASASDELGSRWMSPPPTSATAESGASLTTQDDASILVSGANPAQDEYIISYRLDGTGHRMLMLEALSNPSIPNDRVGRSDNGNVVVTGLSATATSVSDPTQTKPIQLGWAWADVSQSDGDWSVTNLLGPGAIGWAVGGQFAAGGRLALFIANEPFGFEGGTDVRITMSFRSPWIGHAFGRVRWSFANPPETTLERLPEAVSAWRMAGPFPVERREDAYAKVFGPELDTTLDHTRAFEGDLRWRPIPTMRDAEAIALDPGVAAHYLARRVFSPTPRTVQLSLGSDDGLRVFANGREIFGLEVDRSVAPDQNIIDLPLAAGMNVITFKVANTGGPAGFYHRVLERINLLEDALAASVAPAAARPAALVDRMRTAWLERQSERRRELTAEIATLERERGAIEAAVPRTMVMKELPQPRETFVLSRGLYDQPDRSRPVTRGIPAALGTLPANAETNRLGLAKWLVDPSNPLLARVTVNRLWEQVFGEGIVRTTEDFGLQGEWPSHPELLDWLAVEFREGGWNVQQLLRTLVTSSTYRQAARVRIEYAERDPENRLLTHFPRARLAAEQIRDQALFASGLLVEKVGGPSVKPYQPPGLWEEVAMLQSNTRIFQRGTGEDLWRRSMYSYWKRAAPPPALMAFDAPTRESCVVRRGVTNTPLQALALWNDEQIVEASRVLAARTVILASDDRERVRMMLRRCTGHDPDAGTIDRFLTALNAYRARYGAAKADAERLLAVGDAPVPQEIDPAELASWTMLANAALNLDATITKD